MSSVRARAAGLFPSASWQMQALLRQTAVRHSSSGVKDDAGDMRDPNRFMKKGFWDEYHTETAQSRCHHEWFVNSQTAVEALMPSLTVLMTRSVERSDTGSSASLAGMHRVPEALPLKVLHLGCGTSALGIELARHPALANRGTHVTNLDFSEVAIDAMRQAHPSSSAHSDTSNQNEWIVGDALNMPFEDASFDVVLEKGTFDAFEFEGAGKEQSDRSYAKAAQLCREVDRVLNRHVHAVWAQITHSDPELRVDVLFDVLPHGPKQRSRDLWSVGYQLLCEESGFEYYMYTIRRKPQFAVLRVDTHGVETPVGHFVDKTEAERVADMYEARGHHQGYYVSRL